MTFANIGELQREPMVSQNGDFFRKVSRNGNHSVKGEPERGLLGELADFTVMIQT
jgi:hypothetical protein